MISSYIAEVNWKVKTIPQADVFSIISYSNDEPESCLETFFTPFLWTQGWFVYKAMEMRESKGTYINMYLNELEWISRINVAVNKINI